MHNKAQYSIFIVSLAAVANAFAADLSGELRLCAAESNASARLACFDKIAAKVSPEAERVAPRATAIDELKIKQPQGATAFAPVTEETFGLRAGAMKSEDGPTRMNKISSKVAKVETIARGRLIITLENGQVWEQLTADRLFAVSPGDVITVKTGTFNSFLLVTAFNRFTTVNRIH